MALNRSLTLLFAVLASLAFAHLAEAQFGANLPQNDFRWQWGQPARASSMSDFSVSGNEAGFQCDLSGKLRFSSQASRMDVRQLENELRTSLFFIQTAADAMNMLDLQRELDWAVLECVKPRRSEVDEETRQERLDRARERAMKRQAERRERAQQEESN